MEAVPTRTPQPTQAPAAAVDTTGKRLVVLTESYGNEVWDPKFESGDKHVWHFPLHSHMITTDDDLQFSSNGLATAWNVSDDGLTLSWTLRDDAVFHNNEPVTAEDAAWYLRYIWDDTARSVVRVRIWNLIQSETCMMPGEACDNSAYSGENGDQEKEGHASVTGPNEISISFIQPTLNFFSSVSEIQRRHRRRRPLQVLLRKPGRHRPGTLRRLHRRPQPRRRRPLRPHGVPIRQQNRVPKARLPLHPRPAPLPL